MANQFTKAAELGLPKPKGANHFTTGKRIRMDDAQKDKIRAEILAQRLFKFAKAKGEKADKLHMDPAQVAAAKVLIERGKPALQAIEQTEVNPYDRMTEDELEEHVRALITSNPGLIERLGIKPKLVPDAAHNTIETQHDGVVSP